MTEYDGIILAAGKNTRLKGIIPSYHKPMLVVNGKPLITTIAGNLLERCARVIVVVSPENSGPISELLAASDMLGDQVHLVVQPEARGPGDAILRALPLCKSERVCIALGDNVIPTSDFDNIFAADIEGVSAHAKSETHRHISISFVPMTDDNEAQRFTRILGTDFIEGEPGGKFQEMYRCWTGPLITDVRELEKHMTHYHRKQQVAGLETKISPALNYFGYRTVAAVQGFSLDIGTSDALLQLGNQN